MARSATVGVGLTALTTGTLAWLWPDIVGTARLIESLRAPQANQVATFDTALGHLGGAFAALCVAWLWLCCTWSIIDAVTGAETARRGCPAFVRHAVLVACGLGLAAAAAPSYALDDPAPNPLQGLTVPSVPDTQPAPQGPTQRPTGPNSTHVVVRPGQSLWRLAERHLPAGADAATVADLVSRLHALNRAQIGADPDVIHPGLRLQLPHPLLADNCCPAGTKGTHDDRPR